MSENEVPEIANNWFEEQVHSYGVSLLVLWG
jgi:hypothetical protein